MQGHERANQAYWERWSVEYQATHGREIATRPDAWGMWRVPEAELNVLPEVRGLRVLELGCGGGQWSIWLAERGARVTGLDISGSQLRHARSAADAASIRLDLVQASAESIPFAERVFDVVLSDHGAMSWGDPKRTLPEVARVLRPAGVLVFCVTGPLVEVCWDDAVDAPGDTLRGDYFGLGAVDEGDGAVTFNLPYSDWIRLFRVYGFGVDALLEPRPAADATSTFRPSGTAWARRWPAELIWKVRREE